MKSLESHCTLLKYSTNVRKNTIVISLPSNSIIFAVARIQTILARSVGTLEQLQPLN